MGRSQVLFGKNMKISQLLAIPGFTYGQVTHTSKCTIQRNFFTAWKRCACYDQYDREIPGSFRTVAWNAPDPYCQPPVQPVPVVVPVPVHKPSIPVAPAPFAPAVQLGHHDPRIYDIKGASGIPAAPTTTPVRTTTTLDDHGFNAEQLAVKVSAKFIISPCETELHNGADNIKCDENGDYYPVQCEPTGTSSMTPCWCVDVHTGVKQVGSDHQVPTHTINPANPADFGEPELVNGNHCRPKYHQVVKDTQSIALTGGDDWYGNTDTTYVRQPVKSPSSQPYMFNWGNWGI